MDSWQTVFLFRDQCVERVDTPELVQPTERDRAAIEQERKECKKAYQKQYQKQYYAANINAKTRDSLLVKNKNKAYYAKTRVHILARQKEYKAKERDQINAKKKAHGAG